MDVQLQILDDVARVIQGQQPDLARAALEALALEGYRSERLSEGQVRRMLGFKTRMQVHAFGEPVSAAKVGLTRVNRHPVAVFTPPYLRQRGW